MAKFRPITITPATLTLQPGARAQLSTTGGPVKSWDTSNSLVVTLEGAGAIRGRSPGEAVVTAKGGPYVAQTQVTVDAPPVIDRPIDPPIEPPVIEPPAPPGLASSGDPASASAPVV